MDSAALSSRNACSFYICMPSTVRIKIREGNVGYTTNLLGGYTLNPVRIKIREGNVGYTTNLLGGYTLNLRVGCTLNLLVGYTLNLVGSDIQGFLTYKKTHLPRTLP